MNKLAGKELQSLPSQINAGYGEGAAAPDPLWAGSRVLSARRALPELQEERGGFWGTGVALGPALNPRQGSAPASKPSVPLWGPGAGSARAKEAYAWLRRATQTLIQRSVHLV